MKKILIIIAIIVVAAIVGTFIWSWRGTDQSTTGGGAQTAADVPNPGSSPPPAIPSGNTITIGTPNGAVTVKNIYKNFIGWEEEYFFFMKSADYDFLYDPNDGSFVVSVNAGPVSQTIPQAEASFLAALGIGKTDACKLSVTIGVSSTANPDLAGKALQLSFCNSSVIQ